MNSVVRFVHDNCIQLKNSDMSLGDIYRISFAFPEKIMAEESHAVSIKSYTYGEVQKLIERAACGIRSKCSSNEPRGRFIGLYSQNSVEWIVLFWAILKSGNKPYLINLMQPREFTAEILSALDCDTVIFTGSAPNIASNELSYGELMTEAGTGETAVFSDTANASVAFGNEIALTTSGTTLKKKICIYTGREISLQILNCEQILKVNREMRAFYHGSLKMLMFLPLYHIFGLEAGYLWFCFFGVTFVFLPSLTPDAILHTIRRHEVTHVFGVPLLWHSVERAVERELASRDDKTRKRFEKGIGLSIRLQSISPWLGKRFASRAFREVRTRLFGDSIRFCISGGSYLKDSALRLINGIGYPLYNGYGMTEIGITSVELSRRADRRTENSVGKPFGSVRYELDECGHLLVSGESLCKRLIIDGVPQGAGDKFDTGDIMTRDKRGRYYICGRASDLVFGASGEKLNPDFAEKAFELPNASAFCVLGDRGNSKLELLVQLPTTLLGLQRRRIAEAVKLCNDKLPQAYRVAKVYYTYDHIMNDGEIKVSRAFLRKGIDDGSIRLFDSIEAAADTRDSVDTEIKLILRELIASVLCIDEASISDDAHFIHDLGGSSLDYLTLISEIDNRFGITMDFESDGFGYTLSDMAEGVQERICRL